MSTLTDWEKFRASIEPELEAKRPKWGVTAGSVFERHPAKKTIKSLEPHGPRRKKLK